MTLYSTLYVSPYMYTEFGPDKLFFYVKSLIYLFKNPYCREISLNIRIHTNQQILFQAGKITSMSWQCLILWRASGSHQNLGGQVLHIIQLCWYIVKKNLRPILGFPKYWVGKTTLPTCFQRPCVTASTYKVRLILLLGDYGVRCTFGYP